MLNRIEVHNCNGSVEHYFHFLLGFCVPLVHFHLSGQRGDRSIPLAVRECGPLTGRIYELDLNLTPLPMEGFRRLPTTPNAVLTGYDAVDRYDRRIFEEFRKYVGGLATQANLPLGKRAVVLVERGPAPAFYMSRASEIRGAAASRRAIGNHDELKSMLAQSLPRFVNLSLEETSLLDQFAIFQAADIVIAQHGAALANMVFMREESHVIEIFPRCEALGPGRDTLFAELARTMGIGYSVVGQDGPFAPVNTQTVLDAISNVAPQSGPMTAGDC